MSFELLAPHYTWMERVLAGPRLQRCRLAWLEALEGCEDILIAGVGHGHFLQRCAQRFPRARITSVDASATMLWHARCRARLVRPRDEGLTFLRAELPAWQPPEAAFDAIVTPFFLDCFAPAELEAVVATLARAARPAAQWLVADFSVPARGLARYRARAVHALMYGFFRRIARVQARRVTCPDPLLAAAHFSLAGRRHSEWGLLQADWWVRHG